MSARKERHGVLVSVDGPGGVGKSTVTSIVARRLVDRGFLVHLTKEPSRTRLGELIRHGTDIYEGMALACLVAGDRYHHLASEVRPRLAAGAIVLSDRYVPSSFVLQRMDGLDWETIRHLNMNADVPGLAAILNAEPDVIADRLSRRGAHSRFERWPKAAEIESRLYHDTAARLEEIGWPIRAIDCTRRSPGDVATILIQHILATEPATDQ